MLELPARLIIALMDLNVRSGPGVEYSRIGALLKDKVGHSAADRGIPAR